MSDKDFLQWIYDRLVNVHNENELYDYMHKFKEIINTNSVTSGTELVRYHIWFDNNYNEIVDEDPEGEYVRYNQAAKVIAKLTKDANHQCRERVKEFERAEAAEAKLAQIKAQEPVGYLQQHPNHYDQFALTEDEKNRLDSEAKEYGWTEIPLYATPIDQTADIERLRDVANKVIARWDSPHWKVTAPTADVMNELRAALSGKEPS